MSSKRQQAIDELKAYHETARKTDAIFGTVATGLGAVLPAAGIVLEGANRLSNWAIKNTDREYLEALEAIARGEDRDYPEFPGMRPRQTWHR
jgi:hypothetical protein